MGKLRFKLSNVIRPHLWFLKLRDLGRRKAASLRRFAMARAATSIYKNRKKRFLGMSKSAEAAAVGPAKKSVHGSSGLDEAPCTEQDFPVHRHNKPVDIFPASTLPSPSFTETLTLMAGISQNSPVAKRATLLSEMQPSTLGTNDPEGPLDLMPEMLQSSSSMTEELQPSSSMTMAVGAKKKKKKRQSLITEMLSSTAADDRPSLMTEMRFSTAERQSLMAGIQSSIVDRQSLMAEMQSMTADSQSTTANRQSLITEMQFSTVDRQPMTPERQSLLTEKPSSTMKGQSLITEKQSSSAAMSPVSAATAMPSSRKKKTKEKQQQQPAAVMVSSSNKSKSKRSSGGGNSNSFNMDVSQIFARFTCNNTSTVASFPAPLAAKPAAAAVAKPVAVQTFNYDTNKIAFCDQKKALKPKTAEAPMPYLDTKELERKLQLLRGGKELPSTMSSESPSCRQNYYLSSRSSDSSSSISSTPEITTAGLPSPVTLDCLQSSHGSLDFVEYSAYSNLYPEEDDRIQPCYSTTSTTTTVKHRNTPISAISKISSASSSGTHNSLIASYNNYSNSSDYLFLEKSGRMSSTATESDPLWRAMDHNRMKHTSSSSLTSEGSFFTTIDETLTAVTKSFAGSSQVSTPRGTDDRSFFTNERSVSGGNNNNNNYTLATKSSTRRSNSKDILNKSIDAAFGSLRTHAAKSSPPPLHNSSGFFADRYSKRMFASVNDSSQLIDGYSEAINRRDQFFNKSSTDFANFGSKLVEVQEDKDEQEEGEVIEEGEEEEMEDNIYSSSCASSSASSSDSDFVTTPRDWIIGKNNKSSSSNTIIINTPPPFPASCVEFETGKSLLKQYNSDEYHRRLPPPPPSHKISRKAGTKRSVSRGLIFPNQKLDAALAPPDRIKLTKKNSRNNTQHQSQTNTDYMLEQDVLCSPCKEGMKSIKNKNKNKNKSKSNNNNNNNCKVFDSFAMVKCSYDPWRDFKESMVEMIMEKELHNADDLEELLHCYLSLNSDKYHDIIVEAFREVWTELLALNPGSASINA